MERCTKWCTCCLDIEVGRAMDRNLQLRHMDEDHQNRGGNWDAWQDEVCTYRKALYEVMGLTHLSRVLCVERLKRRMKKYSTHRDSSGSISPDSAQARVAGPSTRWNSSEGSGRTRRECPNKIEKVGHCLQLLATWQQSRMPALRSVTWASLRTKQISSSRASYHIHIIYIPQQ